MQAPTWPGTALIAVTKSDSTTYSPPLRQLYIGTGGNVTVTDENNNDVVFKNVSDGSVLGPFFITKVKAATTAADIVGFV